MCSSGTAHGCSHCVVCISPDSIHSASLNNNFIFKLYEMALRAIFLRISRRNNRSGVFFPPLLLSLFYFFRATSLSFHHFYSCKEIPIRIVFFGTLFSYISCLSSPPPPSSPVSFIVFHLTPPSPLSFPQCIR